MKIIAAPGPVCYPIVAAQMVRDDIDIEFAKEGKADIVLDSTVSLVKRGLPIDLVTINNLAVIMPKLGYEIGLTRKGGASDILLRAYVNENNKKVKLNYYDSMGDLMEALKTNKVDSVVTPAMSPGGESLEEYFAKTNVYIPGSCGASVYNNEKEFIEAYNQGIEIIKEKPEEAADFIVKKLPIQFPHEFIVNTMKNSKLNVHKPENHDKFIELVKKYQ